MSPLSSRSAEIASSTIFGRVAARRLHVQARLAAREIEPARADSGVGVLPGHVNSSEGAAADPARVPDRPFGRDVDGLGVDEEAVRRSADACVDCEVDDAHATAHDEHGGRT